MMIALHYAGSALSGTNLDVSGIDVENNSVSIISRADHPQLHSRRATDSITGMVLGHVMEGLGSMGGDSRLAGDVAKSR
mgnify:CR=1 FL=1